jgi:hypothetical protein
VRSAETDATAAGGNKLSRLVWDSYNDPDRIRLIGHRGWACVNSEAAALTYSWYGRSFACQMRLRPITAW